MTEPTVVVEGQPGQVAPSVVPTTVMTAPATEPAPVQPTQEAPPAKYGGKTLEELAHELEEKDRYLQEVNERASRAEHESILTRNLVEQFARDRGRQESVPDAPIVNDDEYLTNPAKATWKMIQHSRELDKKDREQERAEQTVYQARSAFEQGKAGAVKANPTLFRGIDTDLSNQLTQTIAQGIRSGQMVDTDTLKSSDYWTTAAVTYRLSKGEKPADVLRHFATTTTTPMAPVHTETPGPGGPPKAVPALDESERAGAKFFGVTEEQWLVAKGKK